MRVLMKLQKILIKFDFLKQPLNFKVKANEKGTTMGGFIFLLLMASSIYYFVMLLLQLHRDQMYDIQDNKKIYNIPNNRITDNQFQFGFILTYNYLVRQQGFDDLLYQQIFNTSLYEVYMDKVASQQKVSDNVKKRFIRLKPCNEKFIGQYSQLDFMIPNNSIIYCPDQEFLIENQDSQAYQQFLRLELNVNFTTLFKKGFNNLDNIILKLLYFDENTYPNYQQNTFNMFTNYQDIPLNSLLKDNIKMQITPFQTFISQENQFVNLNQNKRQQQEALQQGIKIQIQSKIQYQSSQKIYISEPQLAINFVNSNILQQNIIKINNIYPQILILISQVSALFSMIFFIIKYIYKFYYHHIAYEELMNETFNFDISNNNNQYEGSNYLKKEKPNNPLYNIFSFKVNYYYYQYIYLKLKKKLFSCFCRKTMRVNKGIQLFQKAKSKIQQDLDLTHLLKKLYEIDKLKLLLLNEDQLILFNSLINPIIEVQEELQHSISQNSLNNNSYSPRTFALNLNQRNKLGRNSLKKQNSQLKQQDILQRNALKRQSNISIMLNKLDDQKDEVIIFKSNFFKSQITKINTFDIFQTYQNILKDTENNNKTQMTLQQQFTNGINHKLIQLLKLNNNLYKNIEYHQQLFQSDFVNKRKRLTNVQPKSNISKAQNSISNQNNTIKSIFKSIFENDKQINITKSPKEQVNKLSNTSIKKTKSSSNLLYFCEQLEANMSDTKEKYTIIINKSQPQIQTYQQQESEINVSYEKVSQSQIIPQEGEIAFQQSKYNSNIIQSNDQLKQNLNYLKQNK